MGVGSLRSMMVIIIIIIVIAVVIVVVVAIIMTSVVIELVRTDTCFFGWNTMFVKLTYLTIKISIRYTI